MMNQTPGWTAGVDITGKQKPYYEPETKVVVKNGDTRFYGRICGLASQHVIDMWIVRITERGKIDGTVYPWDTIVMPHTMIEKVE